MARIATTVNYRRHVRRPIEFVVVGCVLLGVAGYLVYDMLHYQSQLPPSPATYDYSITQSATKGVTYFANSFYERGPGANNGAYVAQLTDKIKAAFHYNYHASRSIPLTYSYGVRADVRGQYAVLGKSDDTANVWSKSFDLIPETKQSVTTAVISLSPEVEAPYGEYKKLIEGFKDALSVPLMSDMVITYKVTVSGVVDGTPFSDTRSMTVSAPLDQQLYAVSTKFDKHDSKQVLPQATIDGQEQKHRYEIIGAAVSALTGIAAIAYGLHRRIVKTPYQRELDRIYRYHDGIIIRASRPVDMSDRRIVPVRSFDDMLNLEEELKTPIVATPAGGEATRFVIMHNDVIYMYTLGDVPLENNRSIEMIQDALRPDTKKPRPIKASGPAKRRMQ